MHSNNTSDTPQETPQFTQEQCLRLPKFLLKLYEIVKDPLYQEFIEWTRNGQAVLIKDTTKFTRHVLPLFFKHKSFSSFVRQLNMYNFKKKKIDEVEGCLFYHPCFQRDQQALLPKIKRKNPNIKTKATPNKEFVKSNESNGAEGQSYPTELDELKRYLSEVRKRVESIENNVYDLTSLNQKLVNQVQSLEATVMTTLISQRAPEQHMRHIHQSNVATVRYYDRTGPILTMMPKQFF